ncbi:hypothetical protein H072_10476 [Dactylellina haptotyla CBS 200.50]|uniref:F-box domain-containing protein n=1 Tax=Dactylellina haptotyla (strain CBS 200.50) TaxID=1284197 RepID=S7ZZ54_DACHA|nr:hypothetical protein H072_10476 [Dactylellina haptotyla CBS 200.50]
MAAIVGAMDDEARATRPGVVESLKQGLSLSSRLRSSSTTALTTTALSSRPRPRKEAHTIPYLPTEIIQEILLYLPPHDFDSARLACRDWFQASSCRALLQRNIDSLHSYPGATSRANQWSAHQIQNFSVSHLRRYFTTLVTEWPGSRHRIPCLKTRLDARALLDIANSNNTPSSASAANITNNNSSSNNITSNSPSSSSTSDSFECVGFSRQTGSFAAMVVGRRANRKLYICRLFSKTHLTLESRPHRYSCCPCIPEPGPLYMVFDVKTALNLRIVKVEMEEIENPSSVKELSITFETGIVETYTFEGLAPHRIYQLNIRDKAVRTAALAHTHTHNHNHNHNNPCCNGVSDSRLGAPKYPGANANNYQQNGNGKWRGMWQGFWHRFHKHPAAAAGMTTLQQQSWGSPAVLEVRTAIQPTVPTMMRVRINGSEEACHVMSVPFDSQGKSIGIIAVSKKNNAVYVCGTGSDLPRTGKKGREDTTTAYMHHWLSIPPRKGGSGEISFVSVAPLMHYDFGQKIVYMGVLVGYSNGEIWLWRVNRAWRHLVVSSPAASGQEIDAACEELPKGVYRPEQTPCVSTAIPPPLETAVTKDSMLSVLNIVPPAGADLADSNSKAWKLAYLPGLKALNFVARGVVILAADGKFVWGFDLRELSGFDKNTVYAPGAGMGMYGGVWRDGGEVSVSSGRNFSYDGRSDEYMFK